VGRGAENAAGSKTAAAAADPQDRHKMESWGRSGCGDAEAVQVGFQVLHNPLIHGHLGDGLLERRLLHKHGRTGLLHQRLVVHPDGSVHH